MEPVPGSHLKGYELRERIGAGGFGAVYRAYQSTIGREVAIKFILPHYASHPDFIRRFETEAQLIARLEHPHIIPLYDYWRDPDGAYLVMRWLKGGSVRDALNQGPFEPTAAVLLVDQIAGALATAHRSDIIHRDLKPGNILLDEDGNAYLADFGIAKDLGSQGQSNTELDAIVGSMDYLAPEQARSEIVTPRTDIYSFGVVLYELLTGEHPFPQLSPVERLYKHLNDPLPELTTLPDDIAEAVNAVIQKATAKNPAHRYADVLELAAAFRQALRRPEAETPTVVELLTLREQDILQRIIAGNSNRQIADDLFMTVGTVKWYITQIYRKLGVRSRVQAMVRARDLNLLTGSSPLAAPVPLPTETFQPENPYKGLRAFTAADHQDYFGREKITARLVKRLGETGDYGRFLAVVGPSGSGKSSLVKAGLIPALWRGELPGSEKWFIVDMLPGAQPLDELEVALMKIAAHHSANIREHLERDERGLSRLASLILPEDGSDLLLVIDQFEEVFTLVENETTRSHLLALLYHAVTAPRSRIRVIVTLRADFYDRPLHYAQFGELLRQRLETVLPLSAEELERAIAAPATRMGVVFEPGLVASIVSDVHYQPGALPLLQYALTELFEQREGRLLTRAAYEALGKTTGALARRAEEIFLGLSRDGQALARQMFLRLVTPGDNTEDTRRRVTRAELQQSARSITARSPEDMMDDIIDACVEYRLLALDNDPATRMPTVEVAHEALLREWERLRVWLNESRNDIRLQRGLTALAGEWHQAQQDNSFLLRGSRLEQYETWLQHTSLALTDQERDFVSASLAEQTRRHREDEARKAREAAIAERAATFEHRTRQFQRAALVLAVMVALAMTATAIAVPRSIAAVQAAGTASSALTAVPPTLTQVSGQVAAAEARAQQANNRQATATRQVATAIVAGTVAQAAVATATQQLWQAHSTATHIPPTLTQAAIVQEIAEVFASTLLEEANDRQQLAALDDLVARYPQQPLAYQSRGLLLAGQDNAQAAIADYTAALRLNPAYAAAYINRGNARYTLGDVAGAIADFDAAIRLDPAQPEVYFNRGNVRGNSGDVAGAIADFDAAIRLNPGYATAYNNRGLARSMLDDLPGALADYTEALRLDPHLAEAYGNRGNVRYALDDLPGALADYTEVIRLTPDDADAYYYRGLARQALDDVAGAIADFTAAIALNPANTSFYRNRGAAYYVQAQQSVDRRGDLERALADWRTARQLDGTLPPAFLDLMAEIEAELGGQPTPTPGTAAPVQSVEQGMARRGENRAVLSVNTFHVWTYSGQAGEMLTVHTVAAWDTLLYVFAADEALLAENDDADDLPDFNSRLTLTLPATGDYLIVVAGYENTVGGDYVLQIDSIPALAPATPAP